MDLIQKYWPYIVLAALVLWAIVIFNGLVRLRQAVRNSGRRSPYS